MTIYKKLFFLLFVLFSLSTGRVLATVDGALSGTVYDDKGVALPNAKVTIKGVGEEKDVTTTATGTYEAFPLTYGEYNVGVEVDGFSPYQGKVEVSGNSMLDIHLVPTAGGEMQMTVREKRHLITHSSTSSKSIDSAEIAQLPQGDTASLPTLLYTTNAGMVEGPFGQVFTRGNHANLQYQIDGIQLPDSTGGSFGEAFATANIDHMDIITGGLPAEFGTRLAGVVNIVTKSGSTTPGGNIGLSYGSYNQLNPFANYGGSDSSGAFHYFLSTSSTYTDRGLDTPNPASPTDDSSGGSEAVHDKSYGSNQFGKFDWVADNSNKLVLIAFSENKSFQIPNYPSSFDQNSPFFNTYTDPYGNGPFNYVPNGTNDTQSESNKYIEFSWKHSFGDDSFLQVSPYWKQSNVVFNNDLANDLAAASLFPVVSDSFSEDRTSNNLGMQVDYSLRADSNNLIKIGAQALWTQSFGVAGVVEVDNATTPGSPVTTTTSDNATDNGYQEGIYLQDDLTLAKWLVLNAGVRFDATQFVFPDTTANDSLVEPRVGLNILPTENTKVHFFYGKLFMPAPPEDLRDTFNSLGQGQLTPYDIKAEKDDYFEAGIAQQVGDHLFSVNGYYKDAVDMLDDTQLLNTAIAQPYNFEHGYAYGVEVGINGKIDNQWSDFANYSYEIAKGEGLAGGIFAIPGSTYGTSDYAFLDHCQIHTVNGGLTYNPGDLWVTAEGLFGGGLSTGDNNSLRLPSHFTANITLGYAFKKETGLQGLKASLDVLNLFDNQYPIFIANGFNGNHYEAGRQFVFRLAKEI
ncbi:MAG TPA: TonB-dependent receptor [bacterium]|nr:TonB-dependent receptor [bacterium]